MFYDNFKKLCIAYKTSPSAVGNALGISKSTVSAWKTRGSEPSAPTVKLIADYFGVPSDVLLGKETDDPKQELKNMIDLMSDEELEKFERMFRLLFPDKFEE